MYSTHKLNKHDDNIYPWCTPFPILNQSIVTCLVLPVASWPAYRFLRSQVRWSGIPISLKIFQLVVIYTVKGFSIVNETKVDFFFNSLNSMTINVDNLTSGSSAFCTFSLYIWKFSGHVLLKPNLKDFEHCLASMWNECNCIAVWKFFGIDFLWYWKENWPFSILWPLLSFPNLLAYWVQHFNRIIF